MTTDLQRRAALDDVLAFAAAQPGHGLGWELLPQVRTVFTSRRELLRALQDEWSHALWAEVDALLARESSFSLAAAACVGERAWSECLAANPVLRRLLDEHQRELWLQAAQREREGRRSRPRGDTGALVLGRR